MNSTAAVPEIEIAGVTKQYGNAQAILKSIDSVVAKREFIGIIGPSGCGKSTILKLIAGLGHSDQRHDPRGRDDAAKRAGKRFLLFFRTRRCFRGAP